MSYFWSNSLMDPACFGPYWENILHRSFLYGPLCVFLYGALTKDAKSLDIFFYQYLYMAVPKSLMRQKRGRANFSAHHLSLRTNKLHLTNLQFFLFTIWWTWPACMGRILVPDREYRLGAHDLSQDSPIQTSCWVQVVRANKYFKLQLCATTFSFL